MKKFIQKKSIISFTGLAFVLFSIYTLCSCENEDTCLEVSVQSRFNKADILKRAEKLDSMITISTRSDGGIMMTELQAQEVLLPLVDDGKQIQTSIMEQIYDNDMDVAIEEQYNEIKNLTDQQLATLSFIVALSNDSTASAQRSDLSLDLIIKCAASVSGIYQIKNSINLIILKGGVTATELLPLLKIVGKRYIGGYVAIAIFIVDTVDCLEGVGVL